MTPPCMSQEAYRKDYRGRGCPSCKSLQWSPTWQDFEGARADQERICLQCGLRWVTVYRIAGYVRANHDDEDFEALKNVEAVDTTGQEKP